MPLTGVDRAAVRPRGGVVKVELVTAPDFGNAVFDPSSGCYTSIQTFAPIVDWVFCEDGARYAETFFDDGGVPQVSHSLTVELPAGDDARKVTCELEALFREGVVAMVTMASGERLLVGYSDRFGTSYPLRPAKVEYVSGSVPADLPLVKLTLESADADPSLPIK